MSDDAKKMKTLMLRLEAVTARLEEIAESPAMKHDVLSSVPLSDHEKATTNQNKASAESPSGLVADKACIESKSIQEFDSTVITALTAFKAISVEIGEVVEQLANLVANAFSELRRLISIALMCSKPQLDSKEFGDVLGPLQNILGAINAFKEANRASPYFNHISTVTDGIAALGWITISPAPAPFIGEMKDSAQFYGNRVIKEFKDKDKKHVEWAKSFSKLLTDLQQYVKTYHTTGLSWDPNGKALKTIMETGAQKATSDNTLNRTDTVSAPPPPPPGPPPPPLVDQVLDGATGSTNAMNSVFAELNRGASVTAGLKKVDQSQMTHKNPTLRSSSIVPELKHNMGAKHGITSAARQLTSGGSTRKPNSARKVLEGTKWIIENYQNADTIVIEPVELNQSVYVFNCRNATIQIKGKFNALSLDGCTKIGVAVDTLVSSIDLVKCNSFAVQVFDKCPTIICDVCESGQLYLAKSGFECEVVTSKCGSINVNIDIGDGEYREEAVPEMLKHRIVNGKLETSIVVHAD